MSREIPTAEGTLGPFFPPRYVDEGCNDLTRLAGRTARGEVIHIAGTAVQEDGKPLHNLLVEAWQADAAGIHAHPADPRHAQADPDFLGWGRAATDAQGRYALTTIRPGRVQEGAVLRAPHINLVIVFSGVMRNLFTTLFFEDGPGNDTDPVLLSVPAARRGLLLARREPGSGPARYRFDIRLRGPGELPFFEL